MPKISKKWAIFSLFALIIVATPFIFFSVKARADQAVAMASFHSNTDSMLNAQKGTTSPSLSSAPTTSNAPATPTNTTWYFAEGRVGSGFREYLTLENPATTACAATIQYSYTPDGGTPTNKSVSLQIAPLSRSTASVNQDLGYSSDASAAANVAAVVSVNKSTTPNCAGVVAERPIYFKNFHGINSGTDVLGATHLSKTFAFPDVGVNALETSYLTVFNPNSSSAQVTVVYYAGGMMAGMQTAVVPAHARGTIDPATLNLHAKDVSAVVSANQPILAEHVCYFTGEQTGSAKVSGAYDSIGSPVVAGDWLFAEGYTGSSTQEYLLISNFNTTNMSSSVAIILKSKTGATRAYLFSVGAQSEMAFNVNAMNNFPGASPEVSAEVMVVKGSLIAVERQMYFSYQHTLSNGQVTTAQGGSDVFGQVGPATHSVYTFAEGYANTGYNDWLTIQNPTANAETLNITVVNGLGQSYTQTVTVPGNARFTDDLASLVQNYLHSGTSSTANAFSTLVKSTNGAVFVAERPIYFNTTATSSFGTQGGDDIIGYVGG